MQVSILRRKGTRDRYAIPRPVTTDAKRILTSVCLTWNEAPFQIPPERVRKSNRTKSESNHRLRLYPNIATKGEM